MDLKRIISEEMDFQWIKKTQPFKVGMKFTRHDWRNDATFTITKINSTSTGDYMWVQTGARILGPWRVSSVMELIEKGHATLHLNESDDFQWISDVELPTPFEDLKKGDKVRVLDTTDYLTTTLEQCSEAGNMEISSGMEFIIRDKSEMEREGIDCGACYHIDLDCDEYMDMIYLAPAHVNQGHFWVTEDMVTVQKIAPHSVNESEDFQWIEDSNPTLNELFESGNLREGDIITLKGVIDTDDQKEKVIDGFIVEVTTVGVSIRTSMFDLLNEEDRHIIGTSATTDLSFVESDGDLEVTNHDMSNRQVNESDDFEWIEATKPFELPERWIIKNDDDDEDNYTGYDIQNYLFNKGITWDLGDQATDYLHDYNLYFFSDNWSRPSGHFDAYNGWNNSLEEMLDRGGYEIYDWSDIRDSL